MGQVGAAIVAIGILLAIAGTAGAVIANLKSSALEASNKRLSTDNEYYLRKVNYLEPRNEVLERENETLRSLHNPTTAIHDLSAQEMQNHRATITALGKNLTLMEKIHDDLRKAFGTDKRHDDR